MLTYTHTHRERDKRQMETKTSVCMCVCLRERVREKERENEMERVRMNKKLRDRDRTRVDRHDSPRCMLGKSWITRSDREQKEVISSHVISSISSHFLPTVNRTLNGCLLNWDVRSNQRKDLLHPMTLVERL